MVSTLITKDTQVVYKVYENNTTTYHTGTLANYVKQCCDFFDLKGTLVHLNIDDMVSRYCSHTECKKFHDSLLSQVNVYISDVHKEVRRQFKNLIDVKKDDSELRYFANLVLYRRIIAEF